MNLRSLLQDILNEVSSRIISFQMRLHLLITLVRSSEYFRFIESLRTCIMASQWHVVRWGKCVISLRAGAGSRGATKKGSSKNRPPPQGLFVSLPRTCLLCIVSQGRCLSRISFEILLTRRWKLRG